MLFQNRQAAGRLLAQKLIRFKEEHPLIYALPRGGVVLGAEIAKTLQASLDLLIPRKIGYPGNPEFAVCAVTATGHLVCTESLLGGLDPTWLRQEVSKEQAEAKRRRETYTHHSPLSAEEKTAIIVDDGIATGLTMQAALEEVSDYHPARVVVAVPVLPSEVAGELSQEVDELVALVIPEVYLGAVGAYYDSFPPVSDEEVIELMEKYGA